MKYNMLRTVPEMFRLTVILIVFLIVVCTAGCTDSAAEVPDQNPGDDPLSVSDNNLSELSDKGIYPATPEDVEALNNYVPPVEKLISDLKVQGMDDENITEVLAEQGYGWYPETGAWWKGTRPTAEQQKDIALIRGPDYSPFPDDNNEKIEPCLCFCEILTIDNVSAGGYSMISDYTNDNEITMNLELYDITRLSYNDSLFEENPLIYRAFYNEYGGGHGRAYLKPEETEYANMHYRSKYFEYNGSYYTTTVGRGTCPADVCIPKDYPGMDLTEDEVVSLALADGGVIDSIGGLDYKVSGVCITEDRGEPLYQVQIWRYKGEYPYGSVIPYLNASGTVVKVGHSYPSHILPEIT
ncbi:hypothetical protein Metlim_0546 [Methanoplanus limicola DSM 2279]|uniref:Uncharacterized protein n=2 Tax=Methanoplanus limicola TaxID=2315 RepID=H1Z2U2_9EURY|nr:hypothetical protein Metlim_0546 [Methanoplanus limicola DSM 2279]